MLKELKESIDKQLKEVRRMVSHQIEYQSKERSDKMKSNSNSVIEKYNKFELNEIKNTTYENVWDVAKALLKEKFILVNADIEEKR